MGSQCLTDGEGASVWADESARGMVAVVAGAPRRECIQHDRLIHVKMANSRYVPFAPIKNNNNSNRKRKERHRERTLGRVALPPPRPERL